MIANRSETFEFEITTLVDKLETQPKLLHKVLSYAKLEEGQIEGCSTLTYKQEFNIDYFGSVTKYLETILELMEIGGIAKVNTKELRHGKCLIQEVFCYLEKIEKRIKG